MISQDGSELYISNATYEDGWKLYMLGRKPKPDDTDFAKIERYGPWRLDHRAEMEEFAKIVLALALRASAEEQQSASTGTGVPASAGVGA